MQVNSHNEWDVLREVIVGKGWMMQLQLLEQSFKIFYKAGIDSGVDPLQGNHVKKQYLEEHAEDIEGFVDLLKSHKISVKRPDSYKEIKSIKTPNWSTQTHLTGPLNARDLCLISGNTIIECPVEIRSRYFETDMFKDLFHQYFNEGANWICAPKPAMKDGVWDRGDEMMLDAARCMRIGTDIIVNVNSKLNDLGFEWLRRVMGQEYTFHKVNYCDGHIDSTLVPLRPGLLMINTCFIKDKNQLPEKFRNWDLVEMEYHEDYNCDVYAGNDVLLASKNIDLNVLSIDPHTIICHDYSYKYLQPMLRPYNIECIPCQLRHSRLFDGAFHCLTLDVNRESKLETYD